MKNIIIIPTLNPTIKIIEVINGLKSNNLKNIVVVDDGSNDKGIFKEIEHMGCKVCSYKKNCGKGHAIKTGVKYALKNYKDITGFIITDDDGQHSIEDIIKIDKALKDNIIIGMRNFDNKNVPTKSYIGNKFSSIMFKLTTGVSCPDTQTGLRGIPIKYTSLMLKTKGERFDYEMNFLMDSAIKKIKFEYISIKTIYIDNNKGSRFKPLKDSILIFKEPILYTLSSIVSALIEMLCFCLMMKLNISDKYLLITLSTVIARTIGSIVNFIINKKVCFQVTGHTTIQIIEFTLLFVFKMFASSTLVSLLSFIKIPLIIIKIFVDIGLFFIGYSIQKKYIFKEK